MNKPKFVTMRLGKDSVRDIRAIDSRPGGIQNPAYDLSVVCKQVPRSLKPGYFAILWLGSDNSKGMATDWKQGLRAVAKLKDVKLGEKHNDDSEITVSIGYIFSVSIDKIDLIDNYATAYKHFSMMPLVGLNDYSNQTVREVDEGPRSDIGALIAACGKVSSTSLKDLFTVYPELTDLVRDSYDDANEDNQPAIKTGCLADEPRNLIYFGAPGTGKSYELNKLAEKCFPEGNVTRVTFYPDYTYSQFVGCFKPMTEPAAGDGTKGTTITYRYVFGPFLKTYVEARKHPDQSYLLIVEEINRANPAAVFGDVFQLLDRRADGCSEYSVATPEEMRNQLICELGENASDANQLAIPSNMYIWATMNSADQGVFPMDTAFKRRWDFRYMGINEGEDADIGGTPLSEIEVLCGDRKIVWNDLRHAINQFMLSDDLRVNEDKLLGPFFIAPSSLKGDRFNRVFKDKVLLYLYEDAGKMKRSRMFRHELKTYSEICDYFDEHGEGVFGQGFDDHSVFGSDDTEGDAAAEA